MKKQKLTKEQRKELAWKKYLKVEQPALNEYEKVEQQALKKYDKVEQQALNEYEKVEQQALNEYEKVKELAWKKYLKVEQQALNEYEKVKELAWKKYLKVEQQALKKYDKVEQPAYEKYQEECKKIDLEEIPKIIEYNGRKYKLIEDEKMREKLRCLLRCRDGICDDELCRLIAKEFNFEIKKKEEKGWKCLICGEEVNGIDEMCKCMREYYKRKKGRKQNAK